MKRCLLFVCLVAPLLVLSSCAPEPAVTEDAAAPVETAAPDTSSDPLSGTWSGDWGPSESHRNAVTLELQWDGTTLTGTANPGPDAVALTKASYAADTGAVMMEADATGHNGEMVHYMIEGKLDGNTMMGTWSHGEQKGDFSITRN